MSRDRAPDRPGPARAGFGQGKVLVLAHEPRRTLETLVLAAPHQPVHDAIRHDVEPDQLSARDVEGRTRHRVRALRDDVGDAGSADDRLEVDVPQQGVQVHAGEERVEVHSSHQRVDVDPLEQRVGVDPVQDGVRVDPGDQRVELDPGQHLVEIYPREERIQVEPTDHRLQVDPFHQPVDVDASDESVDVDGLEKPVQVEPSQGGVQVHPVDQGVEVDPLQDDVRVDRVDDPPGDCAGDPTEDGPGIAASRRSGGHACAGPFRRQTGVLTAPDSTDGGASWTGGRGGGGAPPTARGDSHGTSDARQPRPAVRWVGDCQRERRPPSS